MDQEFLNGARQAFQGFMVLAAIPVVLLALWAEYFGAYIEELKKTNPDFDRKIESDKVRMASTCVLLFEIVLFIGSIEVLKIYPKECVGVLVAAVFGLGFAQAGLESKLQAPQTSSDQNAQKLKGFLKGFPKSFNDTPLTAPTVTANPFRALLFGLLGGLCYMLTMIATVKGFALIAELFKFSNSAGAVFVMCGAGVGIFLGLILNFALAPWQLRNSLPVTRLPDGALRDHINEVLPHASKFTFYIVEVDAPKTAVAMVAGFSIGRGLFQPAVFISRLMIKDLSTAELAAVIAHEAAHVQRSHLAKRVALAGSLIIGLTCLSVFAILLMHALFPMTPGATEYGDWQGSMGTFFGLTSLVATFRALSWQSRRHETEADLIAVSKAQYFEDWASALRKIDALNGVSKTAASQLGAFQFLFGQGHLATEIRIGLIKNELIKRGEWREVVAAKSDAAEQTDRAA
jgi:Zn-dependent protease with chaperone function